MLHKKNLLFFSLLGVLLASLIFLFFLFISREEAIPPIGSSEESIRSYWKEKVQEYPPEMVYKNFVTFYSYQDENKWHGSMHILASLLYERYGMDALAYCDEAFQQACYHELMSSYAYEGAITNKEEIDALCTKNWNCLHGIGHGLVMYEGYDQSNLTNILNKCPEEPGSVPIEGCKTGVFMEYITRTMGGSRGEVEKNGAQIDEELCSQMEAESRGHCNFVMVELIISETDSSNDVIAEAVGEYCRIFAVGYEWDCFTGAGFNVKFLTQEQTEGVALCKDIANSNEDHTDACIIAFAAQYKFFEKDADSEMICQSTSDARYKECLFEISQL